MEKLSKLDLPEAQHLALLCKIAYPALQENDSAFQERVGAQLRNLGYSEIRHFAHGDVQGYVVWNENTYVEVFRGTDENADWLRNLTIAQRLLKGGMIHRGYLEGIEVIWPMLCELRIEGGGGKRRFISGHSLGGALATLCAHRCEEVDVYRLYTFGAPKVGDANFAASFDQAYRTRTFRFANWGDPVPRVPFNRWKVTASRLGLMPWETRYVHVGQLFVLKSGGIVQEEESDLQGWIRMGFEFLVGIWKALKSGFGGGSFKKPIIAAACAQVNNHVMETYVRILNECSDSCAVDIKKHVS